MLVTEDKSIKDQIQKALNGYARNIDGASDAVEGVAMFRADSERYDLIIADVTMSNSDTLKMLRLIRSTRHDLSSVVIVEMGDFKILLSCIELGVEGCILKPLINTQVGEELARVIRNIDTKKANHRDMDALLEFKEAAELIFDDVISKIKVPS